MKIGIRITLRLINIDYAQERALEVSFISAVMSPCIHLSLILHSDIYISLSQVRDFLLHRLQM